MYLVMGVVMLLLFFGMLYWFSDLGGFGGGILEMKLYGLIYVWVNIVKMEMNRFLVMDLIFFVYYVNVDWLWMVWKMLFGGIWKDVVDFDWLDMEFMYYDECGRLVYVSVV